MNVNRAFNISNSEEYVLVEVFTGEIVKRFDNPKKANTWGRMQSGYRLDFSDFKTEGIMC